jgi:hypothetical protein
MPGVKQRDGHHRRSGSGDVDTDSGDKRFRYFVLVVNESLPKNGRNQVGSVSPLKSFNHGEPLQEQLTALVHPTCIAAYGQRAYSRRDSPEGGVQDQYTLRGEHYPCILWQPNAP